MRYYLGVSTVALGVALLAASSEAASARSPASSAVSASTAATTATVEEVVVTGTRRTGLRAVDSATPIEVVGADALKHVGQPDLIQTLGQTVPSFNVESFAGDTSNLTLSAALRGLNPNDTLILVDGKRRHTTANLQDDAGAFQGGAAPDLSFIPVSAIDHVEILEDGAAAQYGTDAIGGVINIILKNANHGGQLSATGGSYYQNGGGTDGVSANVGVPIGERGFLNLTAEQRFHAFSQQGGLDARVVNPDGSPLAGTGFPNGSIRGFPNVNPLYGDAQYSLYNFLYNAGYDFGAVQAYSFGSVGYRTARSHENYRPPNVVVASSTPGLAGVYGAPGALVYAPDGFWPEEGLTETDYSVTGGLKGDVAGWRWDLSTTYGYDGNDIRTLDSVNAQQFIDTHSSPTNFYDGALIATQWTNNLDINRNFEVGLATPLNIALGIEQRTETYQIKPGDYLSTFGGGGQSFEGWPSIVAGSHSRDNVAGYADVSVSPIKGLKLDAAGRFEHYSDFGDAPVYKFTARYDFNPAFAIRGTIGTGFRAPTLAEEYFSVTNVGPGFAVPQLPANSPAAHLLGFSNLKPEKSNNYSLGFVAHPLDRLTITADAYEIQIKNRIVATGTLLGEYGATIYSQAVLDAITASGLTLPPGGGYVGVSIFTNGANTTTRGFEATATYASDFDWGHIDWSLGANYNQTSIDRLAAAPALLGAANQGSLLSAQAVSYLTTAQPRFKISFGTLYSKDKWSVNLRETIYGPTSVLVNPSGTGNPPNFNARIGATPITDLEVDYAATQHITLALGANNLLNTRPPNAPIVPTLGGAGAGVPDSGKIYHAPYAFSPFGIDGGYYYGRITYAF